MELHVSPAASLKKELINRFVAKAKGELSLSILVQLALMFRLFGGDSTTETMRDHPQSSSATARVESNIKEIVNSAMKTRSDSRERGTRRKSSSR